MANEFIIRKGYKSLSDSQITGSLSVSNAVTASFFTGSFRGDGSELTGIDGFPFTGSASISGSLTIVGPVTATEFIGNGSQLTGIEGFPYTGSAIISGSLQVTGSISTDTDAIINTLTVGRGGGNLDTNTVLGYEALISNVGGEYNVAVGYKALSSSLADMGPNTAVGRGALQNNVYGFRNTAIGNASLFSNTLGDFNTAVGNTALVNNTEGNENIAIGDGTLNDNIGGDYNTGVGTFALHSNTGGNNNTAIGHSSLYNNITGSNNTAIGTDAGQYAGASVTSLTSVDNSIFIGYQSRALNAVGDTNEIVIGHNVVGLGSNTTVIGNNNTVSTTLKGAVSASLFSGSFVGDGSQLTGIADPTPITATIDNTDSPFTITNETIVIVDSTNGNVTINLPDLDTIVGTENQKPIVIYKNDYSQNVVFVSPNGSQLVNGTTQDIIVSIQIGIVYNPTSAGWVTEGNSYQSLAELELFFVPRTETGSLSVATASYVEYTDVVNKPTLVSGSSQISFSGITNKPTLVSGSSQITYSGLTGIPSGIVSSSVQVKEYNVFATTGSNGFNGSQAITGSLTVTGQVVAQTLNVQQVTSSIVYSSGSNVFGNSLGNTQQFTGSVGVTGSLTVAGAGSFTNSITSTGGFFQFANNYGVEGRNVANTAHRTVIKLNTSNQIEIGRDTDISAIILGTASANNALTIVSNGTATFSSTVTATGAARSINGGVDGTFADAFVGVYNANNNEQNAIQTAVSSGANQSGFRFQASNGGGSADRTTVVDFLRDRQIFYGNVGIGTTSPGTKLEVSSTAPIGDRTLPHNILTLTAEQGNAPYGGFGGAILFKNRSYTSGLVESSRIRSVIYDDGAPNNFGGGLWFETTPTPGGTLTPSLVINYAGRVGIGVSNPSSQFSIKNQISNGSNPVSSYAATTGVDGQNFFNGYYAQNSDGLGPFPRYFDIVSTGSPDGSNGGSNIRFFTNPIATSSPAVERMRITSGGNVLIGTQTQVARVSVDYSDSNNNGISINETSGVASTFMMLFRSNGVNKGSIQINSGNTGVNFNTTSDYRLKEDLQDYNGIEIINKIKTYDYKWKNIDFRSYGVLAHELQEIMPDIISGQKDEVDEEGNEIMQGVDYSKIVPILIKSIQEQQTLIESLKSRIEILEQ